MKTPLYKSAYHILLFLSNHWNNKHLNRLKVTIGSALLILTNQIQAQEKKATDSPNPIPAPADSIKQTTKPENIFCYVVETMPEYPNGQKAMMEFIEKNKVYPEEIKKQRIQGRVIAQFTVETDGSIVDPRIMRSIHPVLDSIAIDVVQKMPKWTLGKISDKPTRVKYTIPIIFKIDD